MGNLKEIVHQMYVDGWRSIYTHAGKALRSPIGVCNYTLGSDSRNRLWLDLLEREVYLGSWKERHAKGVPVKKRHDDWIKFNHAAMPPRHYWSLVAATSIVYVGVYVDYGFPSDIVASFRNFRYKPEWLEKKGGHHAGV